MKFFSVIVYLINRLFKEEEPKDDYEGYDREQNWED